ncbi:MAG: hypothetical protein H6739_37485 [Alphaproteobacteria bacterium]|nr:hypothetical protein [Alphaproteobacteria bacterium]
MKLNPLSLSCILAVAALSAGCGDKDADDSGTTDDSATTNCNADGSVCYLTGEYTEDLTLTADVSWVLQSGVFIGDDTSNTVLTIEPGTTIYGESSSLGMLVIRRNARIEAAGTSSAPIVFTSDQPVGSRAAGDWGGLILNGNAPINVCYDGSEVLPCEAEGEGSTGTYGGDNPNDNSGTLQYVRVEFAGALITSENELNGIAFQAVGSGTTVDYVQVHKNADDGIEFFGGNANVKHVVISGVGDDFTDWTDGWQGNAQFLVLQGAADAGDNGMEADNEEDANDATPRSMPTIANVTLIGTAGNDLGMLLRLGTAGDFHNFIIDGFGDGCIAVDGDASLAQLAAGHLSFDHFMINCGTNFFEDDGTVEVAFLAGSGNSVSDPQLSGFVPGNSAAASGGAGPGGSFFTAAAYYGAIDPNGADWTAGWTNFPEN